MKNGYGSENRIFTPVNGKFEGNMMINRTKILVLARQPRLAENQGAPHRLVSFRPFRNPSNGPCLWISALKTLMIFNVYK